MLKTKSPANGNLLMLFLTIWMVAVGVVVNLVLPYFLGEEITGFQRSIFVHFFAMIVPFVAYAVIAKPKLNELLLLNNPGIKNIILGVLLAVVMLPMLWFGTSLASLFNYAVFGAATGAVGAAHAPALWVMILIGAVLPTLTEETWFRGVFYNYYNKHMSLAKTALITGLFFGLAHGNITQIVYAIPVGIIFTFALHYTRSIWVPAVMHLTANGIGNIMAYFMPEDSDNYVYYAQETATGMGYFSDAFMENLMYFAIMFLISVPFIFLLMRAFRKYHQKTYASVNTDLDTNNTAATKTKIITWHFGAVVAIWTAYSLLRGFGII